jgi:CRISPR-associated protein (TIGR03984 family)
MSELATSVSGAELAGCILRPVDAEACERYIAWLRGEAVDGPLPEAAELEWALAHCDDGVTWGRYDREAKGWQLGHQHVPSVSPAIRRSTIQEVRIFGPCCELLIWRSDGSFRGRVLRDSGVPLVEPDPLRPGDESRIVRGTQVRKIYARQFTHVTDGTGAEQVLPIEVSDAQLRFVRLGIRNYFQQDPDSGAVRIAATRLVNLAVKEDSHGT